MARSQAQFNTQRRNNNSNRGRRRHQNQRQPLRDIDGNIVMGGMETAAPSPAPFNPLTRQNSNSSQGGRGRRRNRNRNRNRNSNRNGQNGQIVKPDTSPINVHAHPQMQTQVNHQILQGQAEPNCTFEPQQQPALQVASTADYSWSAPIKYVHMNGDLTPVDNCGDVVMSEAPSLDMGYSMPNEHVLIITLSQEIGKLQLFN